MESFLRFAGSEYSCTQEELYLPVVEVTEFAMPAYQFLLCFREIVVVGSSDVALLKA